MSKKILGVALAALMLLIVALPAGAQIQVTSLDVRGEVYDNQSNFPVLGTSGTGWDAFNFAGFWYDLKEGLQSESLNITAANTTAILLNGNRNITKQMVFYNTTRQFVRYKVNDANQSNNFVEKGLDATGTKQTSGVAGTHYAKLGWFAEPYVALNGKANKLAKLIIEQGSSSSEKKSLTVGETWDIGDGWTLTAQSIDAKATPRQAWLVLSKDGVKKDDKVIAQGQVYTYIEKSIAGESDVPLFVTYVDSVFAGATSDMVQLRYTWAVSTSITEVKSADKYGILKVTDDGSSLGTIVLWNEDNSISLSTDATIDIGGNMKFKVADNSSYLRFYPMVTIKTPGTYEVRGEVYSNGSHYPAIGTNSSLGTGWTAFNFAGFWYDLKEGLQSESLNINAANTTSILVAGNRNISKQMVFYNTTRQFVRYKVNDANQSNNFVEKGLDASGTKQTSGVAGTHYAKLGWFAEPYVAMNGKSNKLAKLIIEQGSSSSDKKSLTVGETWDIGDGWTLTAQSIDAKATPRQAWLVLSKDGVKKDDKVIAQGQVYTYIEKSIAGESDVPLFVTYVDSVFAGATSDMVQLRYTWAVSTSITEVKSADKYGILKVTDDGSSTGTIVLWNEDNSISLSTDATIDIGGNMKFRVADNSSYLRFYPKVDYQIGVGTTTGTPTPTGTGNVSKPGNVTAGNQTVTATGTAVTGATVTETATPAPTATAKEPGFEAGLAIAGLLAVAFLVLRQRK